MMNSLHEWLANPTVAAALIAASAALGTAIFAFVSALVNASVARRNAILSAQIAQRTKRAEFRQNWINQLRDSFSKMWVAFSIPGGMDLKATEEGVRILLLMNRRDPDYE
jgi:ribulose kinase